MSMIEVSHLNFSYESSYEPIFEEVSVRLSTDWKIGFTGRNGRGKTTFLQLLMGKYEYEGQIQSLVDFSYFPYEVSDEHQLTIHLIEEIAKGYVEWELLRELSLLEVEEEALYRPFSTLSSGEQTKILLAALFLKENRFLLIDEPTNHLDAHGREVLSRYLSHKQGFILVSHDRRFLDGCIDHVLYLHKTSIEVQKGNFSSFLENEEKREAFELAKSQKLKKEIVRLSQSARQAANWSDQVEKTKYGTKNSGLRPDRGYLGHKAEKMMKRSKAITARRQSAIEEKKTLLQDKESAEPLKLQMLMHKGERLILADHISISYGEKQALQEISFAVERGDRIALHGKNGCGKTSLLKLICGEEIMYNGLFWKSSQLVISTVSQDTSFLQGNLSDYARKEQIDESLLKAILRKLDFSRVQFEKDMSEFSGGQKKKVLLAKSLCQKAHLLIWDEPLNHLDLFSRMQIENLILSYQPTMLFVEHDEVFRERVATKVISL